MLRSSSDHGPSAEHDRLPQDVDDQHGCRMHHEFAKVCMSELSRDGHAGPHCGASQLRHNDETPPSITKQAHPTIWRRRWLRTQARSRTLKISMKLQCGPLRLCRLGRAIRPSGSPWFQAGVLCRPACGAGCRAHRIVEPASAGRRSGKSRSTATHSTAAKHISVSAGLHGIIVATAVWWNQASPRRCARHALHAPRSAHTH